MFYPSSYYRIKARVALKGHWQTALLIALIVNLPTLLVQGIATFTGNDPIDKLQAIAVSASRDGIMTQSLLISEIRSFIGSSGFLITQGLNIIAWLITPCLALGMNKWHMDRLRGQQSDEAIRAAFCRAKLFFRAIGLQLLIILKILLWMLPGIGALILTMLPLFQAGTDRTRVLAATQTINSMTLPIVLLMAVPAVMAALRYALSEYIQADEPETKITECIRRSKDMMREKKKNLFFLMFSFLLWYMVQLLAASFLAGMGSNVVALMFQMLTGLALNVYITAAVAAFYLQCCGESTVPQPDDPSDHSIDPIS